MKVTFADEKLNIGEKESLSNLSCYFYIQIKSNHSLELQNSLNFFLPLNKCYFLTRISIQIRIHIPKHHWIRMDPLKMCADPVFLYTFSS